MLAHMARAAAEVKRFGALAGRAALNFVYPPVCPVSDADVDEPGRLAPEAWSKLTFVTEPLCVRCGLPFEHDMGEGAAGVGAECAACLADPPRVARARAVAVYDDASRRLVLELKHAARTDALPAFAAWMALAGRELLADADRILPVPLHPGRLRRRRFNQSALLARALAQRSGRAFDADLLERAKDTETQAGKSASGRAENVAGAFRVRAGLEERVKGARLLLVDDVRTTGATLDAAAKALLAAGAARVDAVTLLRVVRPRDIA